MISISIKQGKLRKKTYPLAEGIHQLEAFERSLQQKDQTQRISIIISGKTEEGDPLNYEGDFLLGKGDGFELFSAIERQLNAIYQNPSEREEEQIHYLLGQLARELKTQERSLNKTQPISQTIPIQPNRAFRLWKRLLFVLILLFSLIGGSLVSVHCYRTSQEIAQLTVENNEQAHQIENQTKIDTFSRYFLTNYYTGTKEKEQVQEKVRRFVSDTLLSKVEGQDVQLKSTFPWEVKVQNDSWKVSYIVVLQTDKETVITKKVTFQLKEEQEKIWVTSIPEEEPFEINQ
ncbi:hypothetical protein [Enterococcus sp. 5B3_DIV0040]|uniref:hypothetical protein n=1 Tax=Enterococcus sp. 5B3_DIV0040 TaxID=1834182 RepID=UPI000A35C052|nr:hypothetical protein [Enterococcus sp. 5B3_DIV0040]OTO03228.1 hypothetical protein A5883_000193 [Enterococcus sp. 5B3_DIV0040]